MRCWSKPCSIQAKKPGSSHDWLRRPPKAAISMSASSASETSPAATYEQGNATALAEDGCSMPRVLIADDEISMRTLVARAIAMDGHATVTAEDGAEALEVLGREPGAFDLLLTDIQMPVMDGIALALTAARDFPDLMILLMTGDRKSTRLNSSHLVISYAVFCLKKKRTPGVTQLGALLADAYVFPSVRAVSRLRPAHPTTPLSRSPHLLPSHAHHLLHPPPHRNG